MKTATISETDRVSLCCIFFNDVWLEKFCKASPPQSHYENFGTDYDLFFIYGVRINLSELIVCDDFVWQNLIDNPTMFIDLFSSLNY